MSVSRTRVMSSVADALQLHSPTITRPIFIRAMGLPYNMGRSVARDASRKYHQFAHVRRRGTAHSQDTGHRVVFVKVGMGVRLDATLDLPGRLITEGGAAPTSIPTNSGRDPSCPTRVQRSNTRDNTPAVNPHRIRRGRRVEITAREGGGSETNPCSPC